MRTFKAKNGNTLVALNDTQADAMISGGMTEIIKGDDSKSSEKNQNRKNKKESGDNDEIN